MSENNVIANALGLSPLEIDYNDNIIETRSSDVVIHTPIQEDTLSKELIEDIEEAKTNIKDIIMKGNESIDELLLISKQGQSARHFEVLSSMIKTMLDANKDLVNMSEKKKYVIEDSTRSDAPQTTNNITNNNLVLSTADLLKIMKGEKP